MGLAQSLFKGGAGRSLEGGPNKCHQACRTHGIWSRNVSGDRWLPNDSEPRVQNVRVGPISLDFLTN